MSQYRYYEYTYYYYDAKLKKYCIEEQKKWNAEGELLKIN